MLLISSLIIGCEEELVVSEKEPLPVEFFIVEKNNSVTFDNNQYRLELPNEMRINFLNFKTDYSTASELLTSCPSIEEMESITRDFNIFISHEPNAFNCTEGGDESSLQLTIYNVFRLMKEVPFSKELVWSQEHDNLYDWMKSLNLTRIEFLESNSSFDNSYATGTIINIHSNDLDDAQYRKVVDQQTGNGAIFLMVLLVHEAWHTDLAGNIGHLGKCGSGNDNNLEEMGSWAVQYYLLHQLAEDTGNFFSEYEKDSLNFMAQVIYDERFCDHTKQQDN